MKTCEQCKSDRIIEFGCKCSDLSWITWWDGKEQEGYVPRGIGLGDDEDYVEFILCINCGQLQNYKSETNEKCKKKEKKS